jgi:cholesterol 25-hydroxylase
MHHQKPLTNMQPFFNHLDRLLGFYCPPMSAGGVKSQELQD